MEEEVVEKGFSYFFLKNKYYFLAGFIVLFLIGFFIGFLNREQTTEKIEEIYTKAIQDKDISICEKIHEKRWAVQCKITISSLVNNSSFCNNKYDELRFSFQYGSDNFDLNFNDYCWLIMSAQNNLDYCDDINDSDARNFCIETVR